MILVDTILANLRHSRPVSELYAGGDRPVDEIRVEPPTLRHVREWSRGVSGESSTMHAKLEAAHDSLDELVDAEGQLAHRPRGDGPAARLVARKARAIEQQYRGTGGRQPVR